MIYNALKVSFEHDGSYATTFIVHDILGPKTLRVLLHKAMRGHVSRVRTDPGKYAISVMHQLFIHTGGWRTGKIELISPLKQPACTHEIRFRGLEVRVRERSRDPTEEFELTFEGPLFKYLRGVPYSIRANPDEMISVSKRADRRRRKRVKVKLDEVLSVTGKPENPFRGITSIERCIRRVGQLQYRAVGDRELAAMKAGLMPRSAISRMNRYYRGNLDRILDQLCLLGKIQMRKHGRIECYRLTKENAALSLPDSAR